MSRRLVEKAHHVRGVGDVRDGGAEGIGHARIGHACRIDVAYVNPGPGLGEGTCDREADPCPGSGDEHALGHTARVTKWII